MMLVLIFGFAILTATLFPETPIGRGLTEWMAIRPLRFIARIERKHLIFGAVVLALALTPSMAMLPPHLALAVTWDVSIFVDAMIATWTMATVARSRASWMALRAILGSWMRLPRSRSRSTRSRPEQHRGASNDDDRPAVLALAA